MESAGLLHSGSRLQPDMHNPSELRDILEKEISSLVFPGSPASLYDPVRYMLSLGGKRMRPVLLLMGAELFNGKIEEAVPAALAVEVFHNFTLLHDDIMDNAPLRRSLPTVHEKWDRNIALLAGDAMFVYAYRLLMNIPAGHINVCMDLFNKAALEVCEGQQMDMDFVIENNITVADYLSMIRLKTAVLLGTALQIGAVIGGASKEDSYHLYSFGCNLGIAFQLQDDILDVYATGGKFGKQIGGDILSNKKTFLLLTALSQANGDVQISLDHWMKVKNYEPQEKINSVMAIYDQLGIRKQAELKMDELYKEAISHLKAVPVDDKLKKPLLMLAEELMSRTN